MIRTRARLCVAATVALALGVLSGAPALAASAAGAGKKQPSAATIAADKVAASLLLTSAALGDGWSSTAAAKSVPPITCSAFHPSVRGAVQLGAAISSRYQGSASGPFVSQTVYVYATAAQARAVAKAEMQAKLERCLSASLVAGSGGGVTFAASAAAPIALPSLGVGAVAYRISGTASQTYQLIDVYLDAIVLAHGTAITQVSFATFSQPADRKLELHLARRLAHLLKAA